MHVFATSVLADEVNSKLRGVKRLWEYSHADYINMTKLKSSDIPIVKNKEPKTEKASLLLAINCVKPEKSNKYKALYNYMCKNGSFYILSKYVSEDPYILVFTKPEHHNMAIGYLDNYMQFLSNISKPDVGFPVDTSEKEFLIEIKSFIAEGGYPSNK